jgi:hypothetical protein
LGDRQQFVHIATGQLHSALADGGAKTATMKGVTKHVNDTGATATIQRQLSDVVDPQLLSRPD